jgi:hypothetical protein
LKNALAYAGVVVVAINSEVVGFVLVVVKQTKEKKKRLNDFLRIFHFCNF